jgi:hypothetical protein
VLGELAELIGQRASLAPVEQEQVRSRRPLRLMRVALLLTVLPPMVPVPLHISASVDDRDEGNAARTPDEGERVTRQLAVPNEQTPGRPWAPRWPPSSVGASGDPPVRRAALARDPMLLA